MGASLVGLYGVYTSRIFVIYGACSGRFVIFNTSSGEFCLMLDSGVAYCCIWIAGVMYSSGYLNHPYVQLLASLRLSMSVW